MSAFIVLWQYREAFWGGLVVTFKLVALASIIGTGIGIALETLCQHAFGCLRHVINTAAFTISAIPALVILFWFYYPAQTLFHISLSPFSTAVIALTVINGFAVYQILADSMSDFPKQYAATAVVLGLDQLRILRYVQIPLLLRAALPRWIDQQVIVLQTSVFASLISVEETFRAAQRINSVAYEPVLIYTSMSLAFLITAGAGIYLAKSLRLRFHRDFSER